MTGVSPLPPTTDELTEAFLERMPEGIVVDAQHSGRHPRRPRVPVLYVDTAARTSRPRRRLHRTATVEGLVRDHRALRPFWLTLPVPPPHRLRPATEFRIGAVLAVRNEQDILGWVLEQLTGPEECFVYVIDNHSSDATPDVLDQWVSHPRFLGWETWPDVPDSHFDWVGLLQRKAEVAANLDVTWAIHTDGDEVRRSPWPNTSLREGVWVAEQWGATLIDFTVVNHLPVQGHSPDDHTDVRRLDHVELGLRPGYFVQRKCWRRPLDGAVVPLSGGGHAPAHPDPVIFPLNFRVDHFPVRSQAHGEKKILQELRARAMRERQERGWHVHYDHVVAGHQFARPPGSLPRDDEVFARAHAGRLLLRAGMEPDPTFAIV